MNVPIRARLTVWYVALLGVILMALGGFLVIRFREDLTRATDRELASRAAQISVGLRSGCEGEFQDVSGTLLAGLPKGESAAQLLTRAGAVLESSGDVVAGRPLLSAPALARVLAGQGEYATGPAGADAESFRVFAVRPGVAGCDAAIVVASSLEDLDRSVHRLLVLLLIAGPVVLAAAAAGGWLLAGRALRPMARMTREAGELGIHDLGARIDVPATADELQRLAITLNAMLASVQASVEEKHRFVSDASHELRTPLAVMRSELEVDLREERLDPAARRALTSALEEVERMGGIVEDLLVLARIDEGGLSTLRERVDLRQVASRALDGLRPLAQAKGVGLELRGPQVPAVGDPARLHQVATNLVANALEYSPPGSAIEVEVWVRGAEAGMTVLDRGPGIEASLLPKVFERFVRGDPARSSNGGSGLGLSICREIVRAHGGRIWVDSRIGQGSEFSFSIPVAMSEDVPGTPEDSPSETAGQVPAS